jgi:amino acid permease
VISRYLRRTSERGIPYRATVVFSTLTIVVAVLVKYNVLLTLGLLELILFFTIVENALLCFSYIRLIHVMNSTPRDFKSPFGLIGAYFS